MPNAILARRIFRELGNADASLQLPARTGQQLSNFVARFETANRGIKLSESERASGMNNYAREYRHVQHDAAQVRFVRLTATEFACVLCENERINVGYEAVNAYADRVAHHVARPIHGIRAGLRAMQERQAKAERKRSDPETTGSSAV